MSEPIRKAVDVLRDIEHSISTPPEIVIEEYGLALLERALGPVTEEEWLEAAHGCPSRFSHAIASRVLSARLAKLKEEIGRG